MPRPREKSPPLVLLVVLGVVAMVGAVACGGGRGPQPPATGPTTPSSPGSSSSTVAPTGSGLPGGGEPSPSLSEADSGHTVAIPVGTLVTVTLHSTYWSFGDPAPPGAVKPVDQQVRPEPCLPGGGCGAVIARYRAVAPGTAVLQGHRDSCGEARRCSPDQQDWAVTLQVTG